MKKIFIIVIAFISFCACGQIESIEVEETTIGNTEHNENFFLTIVVEEVHGMADKPIVCYATITYIGDKPITVYHSDPLVAFGIEDDKYFNNGYMRKDILFNTSFEPEQEIRFEFIKSGAWSANDPNAVFYEEFYKQENLILPAGEYTLSANLKYSTDIDNMLETRQEITTSIDIETDD